MLKKFAEWLVKLGTPVAAPTPTKGAAASFFTTDLGTVHEDDIDRVNRRKAQGDNMMERFFGGTGLAKIKAIRVYDETTSGAKAATFAMDDAVGSSGLKAAYQLGSYGVPDAQASWYGSQGFIGYQMCAIIAQHWLVEKACLVPAREAVRKGYRVAVTDGTGAEVKELKAIERADKKYRLRQNLVEFIHMGRVFGIRVAMFKVRSADPSYYQKPFNADGVLPGTYEGIVQIDPYWIVPELTTESASNPGSIGFYEPTFWIINGTRIHRSHLVIMRASQVADILKPSYLFGGVSIPQKIYERAYAAERCANEVPQLMLTKRSTVFYTDTAKALANQTKFSERMATWAAWLTNFGIKVADKEGDKIEQKDTSLTDLDPNVLTQYHLVAAASNVPITKLMGSSAKGLNATGEGDESNYHEELETIQMDMTLLIERHHICVIRSDVAPALNIAPFGVEVVWNPLDTPTAGEQAVINKDKATTDKTLYDAGAIDGHDIRARLANDPTSGYDGIDVADVPEPPEPDVVPGSSNPDEQPVATA